MMQASHLPGQTWSMPSTSHAASYDDPVKHTQQPIMTGTSTLGVKFDGGVMLAADTLASYGSLARFDDVQRLHPIGKYTCIAAGGDMSDFQHLQHMIDAKTREQSVAGDSHELEPSEIYAWLGAIMYARRSKLDPLWMSLLVGGYENGELVLGAVDLQGTTYTSPTLATGYGAHLALPLMRRHVESLPDGRLPTRDEAEALLERCMKVLFYRDARSVNKFQIATITADGVEISKARTSKTDWGFAEQLRGYGAQTQ